MAWETLAAAVGELRAALPLGLVRRLADEVSIWGDEPWSLRRLRALRVVPAPPYRAAVERLLAAWQADCPGLSPQAVAFGLECAGAGEGERAAVELVWTGPDVQAIPMRRTDQALLEVIGAARESLLIVSFAVYRMEAISRAILESCGRGVAVRICLEAEESGAGATGYAARQALGEELLRATSVYVWPLEHRPRAPTGYTGVLHAKCAVADERLLFISSANLTEHALSINMELGVLVRGGPLPGRVAAQFGRLMEGGTLRRVADGPRG